MPSSEALVTVRSNNSLLEEFLVRQPLHSVLKFSPNNSNKSPYFLYFVDLGKDLTNVSQNLIDIYHRCRESNQKLIVSLLHTQTLDTEKNHYFQKMLDDLGKDKPLHRLVLTKDLYQYHESLPITPFDSLLHQAVAKNGIDISQKGENLLYPLSLPDFLQAVAKIFFLNSTSGQTFWLLGDPVTDLELAYLLKKSLTGNQNFEINATSDNDQQTNSLKNIANKAKAVLNWETADDLTDTVHRIVENYQNEPPQILTPKIQSGIPIKIIHWLINPHLLPKRPQKLTLKHLLSRALIICLSIYLLICLLFVFTTYISLQKTRLSVKALLSGDLKTSTTTLSQASQFQTIGESDYSLLNPVLSFLSPQSSQKVYNLFSFISYTQSSLENIQQTYILAEKLYFSLNAEDSQLNYSDLSLALHSNLSQIYENLTQITYLSSNSRLPSIVTQTLKNSSEFKNLQTLEGQIVQYIKLSDLIPYLASETRSENILVLLQNNQQLRSNGGELAYLLLLNIRQGHLNSYHFYLPEEIDSLYQSTASAKQKQRQSKTTTPQIRDLSQNPDFSQASVSLTSYLNNSLKINLDYIFALNNTLFEKLVSEENPSDLQPLKNSIISASDSAQYRDIAEKYLDRFFNHQIPLPTLGRALSSTLSENQIYLWSSQENVEKLIALQSYSGIILAHPCQTGLSGNQKCFAETSYLCEDQIGSLNQNFWSSRQVSHYVSLSSTQNSHEFQINYIANQEISSASATTTFHLYLSSPSDLNQVLLDDLPYSLKGVSKETVNQLDHYQIPILLNTGQNHRLGFKLTTIQITPLTAPGSYSLTEYRQPGTKDSGINLKIDYPENLRVSVLTQPANLEAQSLNLTLPLTTTTFGFTFVPKME